MWEARCFGVVAPGHRQLVPHVLADAAVDLHVRGVVALLAVYEDLHVVEGLCRLLWPASEPADPVISVGTKKKELVGNFKNAGRKTTLDAP